MANQRKYDRQVRALARLEKTIAKKGEAREDERQNYNILSKAVGNGTQI